MELETHRLVGLEARGELPRDVNRSYQSMRSYVHDDFANDADSSAEEARRLASYVHQVRREIEQVDGFLGSARRFFMPANIALALIAANLIDAKLDDRGIIFYDESARCRRKLLPDGRLFNVKED
ncbi:hypothetical protein WMF45_46790 [Sorangium sp. So ce448]|uniref:hypothetical protein n=1 Tax=Sorangium sp. So ce448 TaxID=3133314 RepID=UPI003F641A83